MQKVLDRSKTCAQNGIENGKKPLILGWNEFYAPMSRELANHGYCPFECEFTDNKDRESEAAMIVFHYWQLVDADQHTMPRHRQQCQLYIFLHFEPPIRLGPYSWLADDFFNMSLTYRMDQQHEPWNVPYPHGIFVPRPEHKVDASNEDLVWTEEEVEAKIALKHKIALQVVSNCETPSLRERYVRELERHMPVDIYGACNNKRISGEERSKQMEEHFFYLAFENSICRHYITEKFWFALPTLTVPVVLSRMPFLGTNIPNNSFIAADDFDSPKELATFLLELAADKERYKSYLDWTRSWVAIHYGQWIEHSTNSVTNFVPAHPYCQLCKLAHQMPIVSVKSIRQFWWPPNVCIPNFVEQKFGL